MTINASITVTMLIEMPVPPCEAVVTCMIRPPACNAPTSRPPNRVPHGVERPSRATVIASKPTLESMPGTTWKEVAPSVRMIAPARPARPPAISIACTVELDTLMPAVRAAAGLAPTARSRKPMVLRESSHQTPSAAATARMMPTLKSRPAAERGQLGVAVDELAALRVAGLLEALDAQQVLQPGQGDVVEHDRGDHLVRAGAGLEVTGDEAPERAEDDAGQDRDDHVQPGGQVPAEADQTGADRAEDDLALATDVEQAGAERQRDAQTGADQRRRGGDRRGDRAEDAADAAVVARS